MTIMRNVKIIMIISFLISSYSVFSQVFIYNNSGLLVEYKIWSEGELKSHKTLEVNEKTVVGLNNKPTWFSSAKPFLLQFHYFAPCEVHESDSMFSYDGYYMNLLVNNSFLKRFNISYASTINFYPRECIPEKP